MGAVSPADAQYIPAVQFVHWVILFKPRASLKVPGGQSKGAVTPVGQYAPAGHFIPVTPSVGLVVLAPEIQKKRDWHGGRLIDIPVNGHALPGGHALQFETPVSDVRLLNVPRGQGNWFGNFVPSGQ